MEDRLVAQLRTALSDVTSQVREVKMFGGIGFMFQGNLMAAASARGLLVRVGQLGEGEALARPGAHPMIMRGRAMTGYVRVAPEALDARRVKGWMKLARAFVERLPPKAAKTAAPTPRKTKAAKRAPPTSAAPPIPSSPSRRDRRSSGSRRIPTG